MFFDPTIIILIPALILAFYAQYKVRSTYSRFLKVPSSSGRTGREVARAILTRNNMDDVKVEMTEGVLSDHYDPRTKVLRLSRDVYQGNSIAALGIAAHETGHAIQDRNGYAPMRVRQSIFPVANIGTMAAFPLFILGLIMRIKPLMDIGILLFTGALAFQLVTLPVEFNASKNAMSELERAGLVDPRDIDGGRKMLSAAALTYVAAAAVTALNLLRLLMLRGSRD